MNLVAIRFSDNYFKHKRTTKGLIKIKGEINSLNSHFSTSFGWSEFRFKSILNRIKPTHEHSRSAWHKFASSVRSLIWNRYSSFAPNFFLWERVLLHSNCSSCQRIRLEWIRQTSMQRQQNNKSWMFQHGGKNCTTSVSVFQSTKELSWWGTVGKSELHWNQNGSFGMRWSRGVWPSGAFHLGLSPGFERCICVWGQGLWCCWHFDWREVQSQIRSFQTSLSLTTRKSPVTQMYHALGVWYAYWICTCW